MGMFDDVNLEMKCPKCGTQVKNFQTKDHGCYMGLLEWEDLMEGDNFYSYCKSCESYHSFIVKIDPFGHKYAIDISEEI